MSEYKDNFIRLIGHKKPKSVAWLVSSEDVELIEKCKAIEEVRVGHTIRLNDMMKTLAMKRVREIIQQDKDYWMIPKNPNSCYLNHHWDRKKKDKNEDENGKNSDD